MHIGGAVASGAAMPEAFDWRSVNGTNWLNGTGHEVRDQRPMPPKSWGPPYTGDCDACWAFSSMDVLSARILVASRGAVRALPATNFLYDCMPGLAGCGFPGDASKAYNFLMNGTVGGAPDESCSPVDAARGGNAQHCTGGTPCAGVCAPATMCRNRTDGRGGAAYGGLLFGVESWTYLGEGTTVAQIQAELMAHGPIAAGMCVNKAWIGYAGGVLNASDGAGCDKIGHDVNYVGWGTATDAEGGLPYWTIRNSHGAAWGEGGFFRVERGRNAWMIEEHMRAPIPRWQPAAQR